LSCFGLDYSTYTRFSEELSNFEKLGNITFLTHSTTTFEDIAEECTINSFFRYNKKEKNQIIEKSNEKKINYEDLIICENILKENDFPLKIEDYKEKGYFETINLEKDKIDIIGMDCEFVSILFFY
jgi:hypothetical protein